MLNSACSSIRGNQQFQAERIADLVAQIEELRVEIGKLQEAGRAQSSEIRKLLDQAVDIEKRHGKLRTYVKENVFKKKEGEGGDCGD